MLLLSLLVLQVSCTKPTDDKSESSASISVANSEIKPHFIGLYEFEKLQEIEGLYLNSGDLMYMQYASGAILVRYVESRKVFDEQELVVEEVGNEKNMFYITDWNQLRR